MMEKVSIEVRCEAVVQCHQPLVWQERGQLGNPLRSANSPNVACSLIGDTAPQALACAVGEGFGHR